MSLNKSIMKHLSVLFSIVTMMLCSSCIDKDNFCIADKSRTADIVLDGNDWQGVIRAAEDLGDDIRKVTGDAAAVVLSDVIPSNSIIVGTIGRSSLIDNLVSSGKLDVSEVEGQWESYMIDVIDGNLIIAGSDKRGTIYGIYEISGQIGVSPWYWWADVPVQHKDRLIYKGGRHVQPSPKVKYRGIFINDEWPSFGGWATERFGDLNSNMYVHIFELLLRLKANYFWPAMWDSRFNEDDPLNPELADMYGIVMGSSHHEPMMRAHQEYTSRRDEVGPWDYSVNKERLDKFFREGMERNKDYENLVTIGMRGDGDVAMGKGNDLENMRTLEDVISGQRQIIKDIYGSEDAVPQLWAIFTEVQRYYDAGFTVPDDVTLLLCDNNWGYIRRTAPEKEKNRKGGVGLYYHIDMNGGPWNDRWVNTSPIPKLREQLSLAYQSGIDRIWIINVGDLKPKELPIDFIMHYAWDPESIQPGDEYEYVRRWAAGIFGEKVSEDVADILVRYPKYNLWRKAEIQVPGIFSVENYNECEKVTAMWRELAEKAERLRDKIAPEAQDAYYQLVYYPAVASAGVAEIYLAATQNQYYASLNDPKANVFADRAKELFVKDSLLTAYYNDEMSDGKWKNMMSDKHIGYRMWSMPRENRLPKLVYVDPASTPDQNVSMHETTEYGIDACNYDRNIKTDRTSWIVLPDLGRGEACMGARPTSSQSYPDGDGPRLEYDIKTDSEDSLTIAIGILPTQDVNPARGLRIGMMLDDGPLQIIDARRGLKDEFKEYTEANLAVSKVLKPLPKPKRMALNGFGARMRNDVFDNLRWLDVTFEDVPAGKHVLKIVMIDPEIVLEKIVVNPDDNHYSYFGPPDMR